MTNDITISQHDMNILHETIRADERNKVIEEVDRLVPEWIDNPLGEVNDYTIGRRDERQDIRTKLNQLKGSDE